MSKSNNNPGLTLVATNAIVAYVLAKLASGEAVVATATATDEAVGVTTEGVAAGALVGIRLLSSGTTKIVASGAIAAGAVVYQAAGGKVSALPVAAGTYRRVGIALNAAAADGDVIEVLPTGYGITATVS